MDHEIWKLFVSGFSPCSRYSPFQLHMSMREHAETHRYVFTHTCVRTHTHTHTHTDLNWPVMKDTLPHPISLLWSWHVAFLAEYLRSSTLPEDCGPAIPSSSQQPTRFVLRNQLIKFLLPVEDFDEATGRGAKTGFHLHVRWDCAGHYYPIRCSLVRVLVLQISP